MNGSYRHCGCWAFGEMLPQLRLSQSRRVRIPYSVRRVVTRPKTVFDFAVGPLTTVGNGVKRRWLRERRRRKVGRAYDMALEIARVVPRGSEVLDVGCGNGYIAHHLSAMLGTTVTGIDVADSTEAPIDYRQYDGREFPAPDSSFDAVALAYVLHHAQDVHSMLEEMKRVLRPGGIVIIYEDIPATAWDRFICWTHDLKWRKRTGACTFRHEAEWQELFARIGLEVIKQRRLSRARNLTHPVARQIYELANPEVGHDTPRAPTQNSLRRKILDQIVD
ncbi:MAG TPA: class I SAM-dependent methyltransferase [Pyrinomonadaceae bacterium]|nr:class I SAM-dependent methyltransferase [Pyrinomonadaceae bacterium]